MKTVLYWAWDASVLAVMTGVSFALADTHYASLTGSNLWPYASWEAAATNIQDAVDTAVSGDTVQIGDGRYLLSNTVVLDGKNITLESVNGIGMVTIDGQYPTRTNRCLFIQNVTNFVLRGIAIANGCPVTLGTGGGASISGLGLIDHCSFSNNQGAALSAGKYGNGNIFISDCVFASNVSKSVAAQFDFCVLDRCSFYANGNTANVSPPAIISASHGTILRNCLIYGNQGTAISGWFDMENCTIAGNHRTTTGVTGVYANNQLRAINCIVWANTCGAANEEYNYGPNGAQLFEFCCTRPQVPDSMGSNNFTLDPGFVNAGASDFRLSPSSQCINTGTNDAWTATATDFLGNPRQVGGTVDRGAYEYLSGSSPISPVTLDIGMGVEIIWNSQAGVRYWIQASTNLADTNAWQTIDQRTGNGGEMNAIYSARNQPHRCFRIIAGQ